MLTPMRSSTCVKVVFDGFVKSICNPAAVVVDNEAPACAALLFALGLEGEDAAEFAGLAPDEPELCGAAVAGFAGVVGAAAPWELPPVVPELERAPPLAPAAAPVLAPPLEGVPPDAFPPDDEG